MKTTFTITAIFAFTLATSLYTPAVNAKMGAKNTQPNKIELNLRAEIKQNFNNIFAQANGPAIKQTAAKHLNTGALQLQTNELVRNVGEQLPGFKFKVVIAD
jgi:hypothetical protein